MKIDDREVEGIRTLLDVSGLRCETAYYIQFVEGKAKRISIDKWFELYDSNNYEVLPPLTTD